MNAHQWWETLRDSQKQHLLAKAQERRAMSDYEQYVEELGRRRDASAIEAPGVITTEYRRIDKPT